MIDIAIAQEEDLHGHDTCAGMAVDVCRRVEEVADAEDFFGGEDGVWFALRQLVGCLLERGQMLVVGCWGVLFLFV